MSLELKLDFRNLVCRLSWVVSFPPGSGGGERGILSGSCSDEQLYKVRSFLYNTGSYSNGIVNLSGYEDVDDNF